MRMKYYALPLDTDILMLKKLHPGATLRQSVAGHLHLILTTAFGEMLPDTGFGNAIWDFDFDNLTSRVKQQELMKQSLTHAIRQFEKRIDQVKVEINVKQDELDSKEMERCVKKRLDIIVSARLTATSENIVFRDSFFVSPLSYS